MGMRITVASKTHLVASQKDIASVINKVTADVLGLASFMQVPQGDSVMKDGMFVTQPLRSDSRLRLNVIESRPSSSAFAGDDGAIGAMRSHFDHDLMRLRQSFFEGAGF